MKITTEIAKLISEQAGREHFSAMLYNQMAQYFSKRNLNNLAKYYKEHALEEFVHMHKLLDYVSNRDGDAVIGVMEAPQANWPGTLEILNATYEHEKKITAYLYALKQAALKQHDLTTDQLLDWFIAEQVEEENVTQEWMTKYSAAATLSAPHADIFIDSIISK